MSVADRVVLVAGASGESGRSVARALTDAGARVVAVGSNLDRLADVAAHARFECDLADPLAVDALAARVRDEVAPIDGLIHLVGGWRGGQGDDDFVWLEERVLTTLRNTSRSFLDQLTASDAGRLMIVSSASVDRPTWSNANYATLKAAAETWVAAVASGWRKAGTGAAVSFVVNALGDGEGKTPTRVLGERAVGLWDAAAFDLNGSRISLVP